MSSHVDPAALEAAHGAARREMLAHLVACAACRDAVASHDPALLFALVSLHPIPQDALDDVSREVARHTGSTVPSIRDWAATVLPRRAAAAAAVLLALLTGVVTMRPTGVPVLPTVATLPPASAPAPRADVEVAPAEAVSQVVDLAFGDAQVVMVYNGDLDL